MISFLISRLRGYWLLKDILELGGIGDGTAFFVL